MRAATAASPLAGSRGPAVADCGLSEICGAPCRSLRLGPPRLAQPGKLLDSACTQLQRHSSDTLWYLQDGTDAVHDATRGKGPYWLEQPCWTQSHRHSCWRESCSVPWPPGIHASLHVQTCTRCLIHCITGLRWHCRNCCLDSNLGWNPMNRPLTKGKLVATSPMQVHANVTADAIVHSA